jgi:hypothetical protein
MNKAKVVASTTTVIASPSGEGMQLELHEGAPSGVPSGGPFPILTILKNDQEHLWVELYTGAGPVRVPLKDLQAAIERAAEEVRSEASYDK